MTSVLTLTDAQRAGRNGAAWAPVAIITVVGAAIAAITPFDRGFAFLTFDSPAARVVLLVAAVAVGLYFAGRIGARVESHDLKYPFVTPMAVAAAVAVWVTVLDAYVFRSSLDPGYARFISTAPLVDRYAYFMLRAFNESILYRLFLASLLVWAIGLVWRRDGRPANSAFWLGIVLSQAANIALNVTFAGGFATTPEHLVHDALRYVVPGVVWGYLYFRYGFVSHETAAVGTHLFIQPLLGVAFH